MVSRLQSASIDRQAALILRAADLATLVPAGRYTSPRSWGVYKLPASAKARDRYRHGNHPVRQSELVREFGAVETIAVLTAEADALELKRLLNAR